MNLDEHGNLSGTSTCLWEAITSLSGERTRREKEYSELQRRLGESACLSGQELGVTPTPEGWIIHVNACYESGRVNILIPKDETIPIHAQS